MPPPPPPVSPSLSLVCLLMCEIILGWRDGFLPEGLSGGVSLLFNNRLGMYVYLSILIDYRLVLDNKLHSSGQIDGRECFNQLSERFVIGFVVVFSKFHGALE